MHIVGNMIAALVKQVGVNDQQLRARVLQDVTDLVALEVPVDRNHVGADVGRTKYRFEVGKVIPQHDGDGVVFSDAKRTEGSRGLGAVIPHLSQGDAPVSTDALRLRLFHLNAHCVIGSAKDRAQHTPQY